MQSAIKDYLLPRNRLKFHKPRIENFAFQLHYNATVTILVASSFLVCAREYFGQHIRCIADDGVPHTVINTYCFFMATFTIVRHYNESLLQGGFLPHPGVGPMMESDEILHHTYYQWVPFVLFLQSLCFYLPHYVWKFKEGGRIRALVDGLRFAGLALEDEDMTVNGMVVPSKQNLSNKLDVIREDIILRLRMSRTWSTWLVTMEVVNLLHVMLQIWTINKFLKGNFIRLGPWMMSLRDWNQISDPLETVFPKVTKCLFHKYGPSGSIQQHDALCVMALNIIHEKIYTVLWFWMLFLLIASLLAVIWRLISFVLYRCSLRFNKFMFQNVSGNKFNPHNVMRVVNSCQYGDWLFLYYLAKNMQGFVFQALFVRIAEELEKREKPRDQTGYKEKEAEKALLAKVDNNDETLPLKQDPHKKIS